MYHSHSMLPEQSPFKSLVVDLTHRCNMECANCYLPNRDIPDLEMKPLYELLKKLPVRTYVRLIGGEPTLREDLPDIIQAIIALGHKPSLTTNGLKLAHLDYCQDLRKAGLRHVLISMNGADDDAVYRILDGGKYAGLKSRAFLNALKAGFMINTGTIIAKGVNPHTVSDQVRLIEECALNAEINFDKCKPWSRVTPVLRIKTVGALGRYMEGASYRFDELVSLIKETLGARADFSEKKNVIPGLNFIQHADDTDSRSMMIPVETKAGQVFIRLIDWATNENGVPDPGSQVRGRVTRDFRVAPFFEDIKLNEFGY